MALCMIDIGILHPSPSVVLSEQMYFPAKVFFAAAAGNTLLAWFLAELSSKCEKAAAKAEDQHQRQLISGAVFNRSAGSRHAFISAVHASRDEFGVQLLGVLVTKGKVFEYFLKFVVALPSVYVAMK